MGNLTSLRIVFLIAVTAIAVLMQFTCAKQCTAQFSSQRGLSRHRNGCPIYKTAAALRAERRRYDNPSAGGRGGSNGKRHLDADEQATSGLNSVRVWRASPIILINSAL